MSLLHHRLVVDYNKITFQLRVDHLQMCVFRYVHLFRLFCFSRLDVDPMTLMCDLNPDIVKMYLLTKNEASKSRLSNIRTRTGQTHVLKLLLCHIHGR